MKNVLLVLATTLSLAACEKDEKKAEATATDVAADTVLAQDSTETTVDVAVSVTPDVVSESQDVTVTD